MTINNPEKFSKKDKHDKRNQLKVNNKNIEIWGKFKFESPL